MNPFRLMTLAVLVGGCAYTDAVQVTPDRPNPEGVRVWGYRTLLIRQGGTVRVEHIPDPSREYAVRIGSVLATNDTALQINPNGTLSGVTAKLDSTEALGTLNNLIEKLPALASGDGRISAPGEIQVYDVRFLPDGSLEVRPLLEPGLVISGSGGGTAAGTSTGLQGGGSIRPGN